MKRKPSSAPIIITILLVLGLCCLCICLILFVSGSRLYSVQNVTEPTIMIGNHPNPVPITTSPPLPTKTSQAIVDPTPTPNLPVVPAEESLKTLRNEIVPINDPIELAERLGGKSNIPKTYPDPNAPYSVGDHKIFWVTNVDTNENFQITATVRYLGDNVYIWIENGVTYDEADLVALGDTFDKEIYPTTRAFFGSEWSPGVDHDPRIHIVYAGGLGQSLAGYYSSADQLHPDAHEFSNAHEMFLINSDTVYLWQEYIYGTLAHEFQHMIHWHIDRNEETWLNEGFSMLSEILNGYNPGGFDYAYIKNPDLQLTDWGAEIGSNAPHYGASMLFTTYFFDRFGVETTKALVANPKNGMESIDDVLAQRDIRDPLTGEIITAEDVFADWAVTNILGDSSIADGRYHYEIYPNAPLASPSINFTNCPQDTMSYSVTQFGVDYLSITCSGEHTLIFSGNTTTRVLPTNPYSGKYYFWSNMGDHSNMSLERPFDFREVSGPLSMTFQTWYDLEKDYDYVFVSASTDEENWQILNTTSCTMENPSGNSYGCGLNGSSDGWQQETVNLDMFAGKEVTIRFDYVTDAAVNGDGILIDDIQIDAIGYFTDFELDNGGWYAEGFVRIKNILPQMFRVSMITFGDEITVSTLHLDEDNKASLDFKIGADIDSIVLVISGTTPYTRQKAQYQLGIE